MNPLLKFINKSVIQPINKVQKGIHNLSLYRAYVKNPKNFANSVNESLQHYSVRYPVLQSNYFARDLHGPFILNPYRVKLDMPDVSIGFKFNSPLGSFSSDNKIINNYGILSQWKAANLMNKIRFTGHNNLVIKMIRRKIKWQKILQAKPKVWPESRR